MEPGARDANPIEEHTTTVLQPSRSWTLYTPPLKEEQQLPKNSSTAYKKKVLINSMTPDGQDPTQKQKSHDHPKQYVSSKKYQFHHHVTPMKMT